MALSCANGAVQWLNSDVATTVYTISGLSFQPKALRFTMVGLQNAATTSGEAVARMLCVGFAVSTSSRRAVVGTSADNSATANCGAMLCDDCIAVNLNGGIGRDAQLDLDSITSDGFTLIVDDATPSNRTVFWQAWGGSDITVAVVGDIAEPAATGNQDYTATGFVSGATNQVVLFAGCQSTAVANTIANTDSGVTIGWASSGNSANNVVICGNSDDAGDPMVTDSYCQTGKCLAMIAVGGGNPDAEAQLTQFGTDNFRLNWTARALTDRRNIFLAMKGGSWTGGAYTIDGTTGTATATVSGLAYTPVGLLTCGTLTVQDAAATSHAQDLLGFGAGVSTSDRRAMGVRDEDTVATSEIDSILNYAAVLSFPSDTGTLLSAYDIDAMNSDGFRIIVDTAGGVASEWQGYLTFGDATVDLTTTITGLGRRHQGFIYGRP